MTDTFFDMLCGMFLTLFIIFLFIGLIAVVATIFVYTARVIAKWWRNRERN